MASWSGARSLIQGCCVDRLRTSSVADADRRRPSQYSIGDEALGRLTPRPRQHNPHRRLAIVDTTVAYCLSVIRLLSSWHQNQLQCDSVRLLNHGVPADLDRGAMVNIVRIGRKAAIHELQSRYAVRDLRLLQARKRCTLRIELSPPVSCQAVQAVGRPRHPSPMFLPQRLRAGYVPIVRAANGQRHVELPQAIAQEHYVAHGARIAGAQAGAVQQCAPAAEAGASDGASP